jgi:hypothetical protein
MIKKILFAAAAIFLLAIPVWLYGVAPRLTQLPSDFSYEAEIFSVDNFYDETAGDFGGDQISVTQFSYNAAGKRDGVLEIQNVFDVRTPSGDPIFAVERVYGVNLATGKHVPGYGDKDREGYVFAPKNLKEGQPFSYWHINYDGPAKMSFVGKESILGLVVYRYESRYEDVDIDQTAELGFLPGVGQSRGVNLDPYLRLWVEPKTGRMVKYEDDTTAYYYDLATKQRIHPWNKFNNRYTQSSIAEQVRLAKKDMQRQTIARMAVPIGFGILFLAALFGALLLRTKKQKQSA